MAYTVADRVMDFIDDLRRGTRSWFKADAREYFPIVCPHNSNVLALHNGSLLSVIRIDGYMGQYFPDQFEEVRNVWAKFFQTISRDKSAKGFDLFWSYEFDPEGMQDKALTYREQMIKAAERRGLDVKDVIEEEAHVYGAICANEAQYLMVVTHLDSLMTADRRSALTARGKDMAKATNGASSMPLQVGVKALDALHEQHVNKVSVHLENAGMGYTFERLDCYEFLKSSRHSFKPGTTGPGWSPRLTMRDCRFRSTDEVPQSVKDAQKRDKPADWSFMQPPTLAEQMVPEGIVDLGPYSVVGDRIYAPLHVTELAVAPQPLEDLLTMCFQRKLPIRIVYSIMANSADANYWNRLFASLFTFASASNRQISKADKAMQAYEESNGTVFGYGISMTTWAKTSVVYGNDGQTLYDVKQIQKRVQDVETLAQQWGGQQLGNLFGCAVEATMDATLGYSIPPSCPKAPQIEMDVIAQLPVMRPARLWKPENSIWMRTPEGVLSPYQPFSSRQNVMLSLVLGGMGYGKSNLLSEHIFYFGAHPEIEETPYIRGIDFGYSASGVVSMLKDGMPVERQHEVNFDSFTNDGKIVKNLFDTRPGLYYPLEDHRRFLINTLVMVCADVVEKVGVGSVVAVLKKGVDRLYQTRDPNNDQFFDQKLYQADVADPLVRQRVLEAGLPVESGLDYWEITHGLIDHGFKQNNPDFMHAARIAQRHAVPRFGDLVRVVDMLANEFEDAPLCDGRPLTAAIAHALLNANALFPCFSGITNTDISESRICVLDVSEAFGRGDTKYDHWQRSVMFSVVYRLLTEDLFVNQADTAMEIERNQDLLGVSDELLAWHRAYFERQDQIYKVFLGDELHRIGKVHGASALIDSMGYEGRKYKVGMILGTQMPQHFPPDMIKLASSVFIFGASQSSTNADVLQELFDLSKDERQSVLDITKPDAVKGAEVFVIHKVDEGVQRLKLHFQMGNIKRWAYATAPNERALRGILYKNGPSEPWARSVLAQHVPSVEKAIERKRALHAGDLTQHEAITEIAKELLRLAS